MNGAGDLDRRIVIERNTPGADDAFGESAESWAAFITYSAKREDVRDSEKAAARQVSGSLMSRFTIRSSTDSRTVNTKDRINYDGKIWQIHGVKEAKGRRHGFLEITASTEID